MARFLIEVPHDNEVVECAKAVRILLSTGSHFLTNADWGCEDGEHKAWLIADVHDKAEARAILPPEYRFEAKIVRLNKFTMEEVDSVLSAHEKNKTELES